MRGDVLVIGAGLSGATAAMAARRAGVRVVLAYRGFGRTALSGGLFALANAAPSKIAAASDLARAIAETRRLHAAHPFAVDPDPLPLLRAALDAWRRPLSALYDLDWAVAQEAPKAYVHEFGALCYAQLAPRSCLAVTTQGPRRIGVVELASFAPFMAAAIARNLNEALAENAGAPDFVPLPVPFAPRARYLLPAQLAAALDRPEVAAALLAAVKSALRGTAIEALLFAPVLGLGTPDLARRLADALELPVFEACAAQNSVFGLRLQNALIAALHANDIELVHESVSALDGSSGGVFQAAFANGSAPLTASRVVLATGKFLAGGLTVEGRMWREPLADCPLFLGAEPIRERHISHLSQADFFAAQAMAYVGLQTDAAGRVLDERGRPYCPGLFTCGHLLGGFDAFAGTDGAGVDLTSGWRAGQAAASEAQP